MDIFSPTELSSNLLPTFGNKNTVASITVLTWLYYPYRVFHLKRYLQKILEFLGVYVFDEESEWNYWIDILLFVLVIFSQILKEGIFIAKHIVVTKVIVNTVRKVKRFKKNSSFSLSSKPFKLFVQFLMKEWIVFLTISFIFLCQSVQLPILLALLDVFQLSLNSGMMLQLSPYKICRINIVCFHPPPTLLQDRFNQITIVTVSHKEFTTSFRVLML